MGDNTNLNEYIVSSGGVRKEISASHPYLAAKKFVKDECVAKTEAAESDGIEKPEEWAFMSEEEKYAKMKAYALNFSTTIAVIPKEHDDLIASQAELLATGKEVNQREYLTVAMDSTYKYSSAAIMQELGFFY